MFTSFSIKAVIIVLLYTQNQLVFSMESDQNTLSTESQAQPRAEGRFALFNKSFETLRELKHDFPICPEFHYGSSNYRKVEQLLHEQCRPLLLQLHTEYPGLFYAVTLNQRLTEAEHEIIQPEPKLIEENIQRLDRTLNAIRTNCISKLSTQIDKLESIGSQFPAVSPHHKYKSLDSEKEQNKRRRQEMSKMIFEEKQRLEVLENKDRADQQLRKIYDDQINFIQQHIDAIREQKNQTRTSTKNTEIWEQLLDDLSLTMKEMGQKFELERDPLRKSALSNIEDINKKLMSLTMQLGSDTIYSRSHIIMVLDHSYSMMGQKWGELEKAVKWFVDNNKNQDLDLLSIIVFESTATEILKRAKFYEYNGLDHSGWGSTNYDAAFDLLETFVKQSKYRPIVVFLTDGDPTNDHRTNSILEKIAVDYKQQGLMFFGIGIGEAFNSQKLKEITVVANSGKEFVDFGNERLAFLHSTRDEKVLGKIFATIADSIQSFDNRIKATIHELKNRRDQIFQKAKEDEEHLKEIEQINIDAQFKRHNETAEKKIQMQNHTESMLDLEEKEQYQKLYLLLSQRDNDNNSTLKTDIVYVQETIKELEGEQKELSEVANDLTLKMQEAHQQARDTNQTDIAMFMELTLLSSSFEQEISKDLELIQKIVNALRYKIDKANEVKLHLNGTEEWLSNGNQEIHKRLTEIYTKQGVELKDGRINENFKKIANHTLGMSDDKSSREDVLNLLLILGVKRITGFDNEKDGEKQKVRQELQKIIEQSFLSKNSTQREALDQERNQLIVLLEEIKIHEEELSCADSLSFFESVSRFCKKLFGYRSDIETKIAWLRKEAKRKQIHIDSLNKKSELMTSHSVEDLVYQVFNYYKQLNSEWSDNIATYEKEKHRSTLIRKMKDFVDSPRDSQLLIDII